MKRRLGLGAAGLLVVGGLVALGPREGPRGSPDRAAGRPPARASAAAPAGPAAPAAPALAATPRVPTTARDFILPGSQPGQLAADLQAPSACANCHANYGELEDPPRDRTHEIWYQWQGSLMAQAGRDPLFLAALELANADAAGAGEYCLRCHMPGGWLAGRSAAADGSAMTETDREGVHCAVCHRLVDPVDRPGNPERDRAVRAAITLPVSAPGTAAMLVDPEDHRRGPRDLAADWRPGFEPHLDGRATLTSPYHRRAELCGTCHDIDNPLFAWDAERQAWLPGELDRPAEPGASLFPVERTYSEWRLSAFNSPEGVYAPDLGGRRARVSTCQDCHMADIAGAAGMYFGETLARPDLAAHDLTGAGTWVPRMIPLHPSFGQPFREDPIRAAALVSGTQRARAMLRRAAGLSVIREGDRLIVTVANRSGHKLPTGYVEGRRMWLAVEGYDAAGRLVFASGRYDPAAARIVDQDRDPQLKTYEAHHGLSPDWAERLGLEPGPSFHFALNNLIVRDDRIPPLGYRFAAFAAAGAAPYTEGRPDPARYRDGQAHDQTVYRLPPGVARGRVRLLYQTATADYIAFLRDASEAAGGSEGRILASLWEATDRSPPEVMAERSFAGSLLFLPMALRR